MGMPCGIKEHARVNWSVCPRHAWRKNPQAWNKLARRPALFGPKAINDAAAGNTGKKGPQVWKPTNGPTNRKSWHMPVWDIAESQLESFQTGSPDSPLRLDVCHRRTCKNMGQWRSRKHIARLDPLDHIWLPHERCGWPDSTGKCNLAYSQNLGAQETRGEVDPTQRWDPIRQSQCPPSHLGKAKRCPFPPTPLTANCQLQEERLGALSVGLGLHARQEW